MSIFIFGSEDVNYEEIEEIEEIEEEEEPEEDEYDGWDDYSDYDSERDAYERMTDMEIRYNRGF
jgi:hypothetical protein